MVRNSHAHPCPPPLKLYLVALYAEMRDGLLADDTEYASKKLKEQLKCAFCL